MGGNVKFMPRDAITGERLELDISPEDDARFDALGRGYILELTDTATGAIYAVERAACSLPDCWCDAVASLTDSVKQRLLVERLRARMR